MIVELIVGVLAGLFRLIAGLFPSMDTPGFLTALAGLCSDISAEIAPLGAWIPFGPAGTATSLVLVAGGVALTVRLIRVVASFLTGGGGSAA